MPRCFSSTSVEPRCGHLRHSPGVDSRQPAMRAMVDGPRSSSCPCCLAVLSVHKAWILLSRREQVSTPPEHHGCSSAAPSLHHLHDATVGRMPSRASRPRSHNGCLQCREKHVKCDQTLPICRRCLRNSRPCSLAVDYDPNWTMPETMREVLNSSRNFTWKQFVPATRASDTTEPRSPTLASSSSRQPTPQWTLNHSMGAAAVSDRGQSSLNAPGASGSQQPPPARRPSIFHTSADEELYQHFIHVTASTIGQNDPVLLHLYQTLTPALAATRPHLMSCVLAMSGNHRLSTITQSRTNSSPEAAALQKLVLEYQSRALNLYSQEMGRAQTIDDCAAVALSGILVLMFTFADRPTTDSREARETRWALLKAAEVLSEFVHYQALSKQI